MPRSVVIDDMERPPGKCRRQNSMKMARSSRYRDRACSRSLKPTCRTGDSCAAITSGDVAGNAFLQAAWIKINRGPVRRERARKRSIHAIGLRTSAQDAPRFKIPMANPATRRLTETVRLLLQSGRPPVASRREACQSVGGAGFPLCPAPSIDMAGGKSAWTV